MKQKYFLFLLPILMVAILSIVFVACSSSDDDEIKEAKQSNEYIRKMTCNGYETYNYRYDSKGRIISDGEGRYTYSDNLVVYERGNHVMQYSVVDGLIRKVTAKGDGDNCSYSYDKDGYLVEEIFNDYKDKNVYTWSGGNITKITNCDLDGNVRNSMSITYTNIRWPKNWLYFWVDGVSYRDMALAPSGLWGKIPKNLPEKFIYQGNTYTSSFDYSLENGIITHFVMTDEDKSNNRVSSDIYYLEWN